MNTTQTQINHLIKTLAEQLRLAESFDGMWGKTKERVTACKSASKTVVELEKLGLDFNEAFDKAETLNKVIKVVL